MVLSALQQVVVSAVLVLCVFVVMPRIFGGGGGGRAGRSPRGGKTVPGHYDPRQPRRVSKRTDKRSTPNVYVAKTCMNKDVEELAVVPVTTAELIVYVTITRDIPDYTVQFVLNSFLYSEEGSPQTLHRLHLNSENSDSNTYQSIQQMRNAMEKEIKSERTRGNGRELAFTLMPLYALGVGVFAAYKFLKMKSHEESLSKNEKSTEDKAKETEHQLLELEKHLAQTEKMLNSLLTQLDPLSNCVNTLACEQKDEIMTQLQSIRRLMKESGLDKSEDKMKDVGHICNEKLEDLIQSFTEHSQEKEIDDREDASNEDSCEEVDYKIEEHGLCDECEVHQFEPEKEQEMINKDSIESEEVGLRRRNRYE